MAPDGYSCSCYYVRRSPRAGDTQRLVEGGGITYYHQLDQFVLLTILAHPVPRRRQQWELMTGIMLCALRAKPINALYKMFYISLESSAAELTGTAGHANRNMHTYCI